MADLRVAFVLPDLVDIGAQRVAFDVRRALRTSAPDLHVDVVAGFAHGRSDWRNEAGVHCLVDGGPLRVPLLRRYLFRRRLHRLARGSYDVLVGFTPQCNIYLSGIRRGPGRPALVATEHILLTRAIGERSMYSRSYRRGYRRLVRGAYRDGCFHQIVAVSAAIAADLRDNWGVSPSAVTTITNPVRPGLEGMLREPGGDVPTVVAIGRLEPQKGHDLLLLALAQVRASRPGLPLHAVIAGGGTLAAELDDLRSKLGLEDVVDLVGHVDDVRPLLQEASVFVLPSRWEGYPLSLVEAVVSGAACVAADCPSGPREILADGERGVLIPSEDVEALADALGRLLADPAERARYARRAAAAAPLFSADRIAVQYAELLRDAGGVRP